MRVKQTVKLADLATHAGVSSFHLQRTFKRVMGISPRQYLAAFGNFKTLVREGEPVTQALYDSGFNSSSRLYEHAPSAWHDARNVWPRRPRHQHQLHDRGIADGPASCCCYRTRRVRGAHGRRRRTRKRFARGVSAAARTTMLLYKSRSKDPETTKNRSSICRWISDRLRFSARCGNSCARFRMVKQFRTARWRRR